MFRHHIITIISYMKKINIEDLIEAFEGEAVERLESFIESMNGDKRFLIPVEEADDIVSDHWSYVFTDRGNRLVHRMIDRLYKLAKIKFGEEAVFDMDISTHMFQEI